MINLCADRKGQIQLVRRPALVVLLQNAIFRAVAGVAIKVFTAGILYASNLFRCINASFEKNPVKRQRGLGGWTCWPFCLTSRQPDIEHINVEPTSTVPAQAMPGNPEEQLSGTGGTVYE